MKAVILPTAKTADLVPLTSWLPEYLLPVVNKPLAEHLIELLARHEIRDILLVLKHMPFETEKYFGDGSRWGVHLSYSLLRKYRGLADALGHLDSSRLEVPLLCLPGDIVTDLDLSSFVVACGQGRADVCLAQKVGSGRETGLQTVPAEDLGKLEGYPFITTRQTSPLMTNLQPSMVSSVLSEVPSTITLSVEACEVAGRLERIQSPVDLLRINQRVLAGDFPALIIPGKMVAEGIWVGRHSRIHRSARLEAPMLIGDQCNIQSGAVIGSGSVVGNQVIVDEGASVQGSLILDRTYVGAHTDLRSVVVKQNWMLQIPSLLSIHLGDDLILGDLEKKTVAAKGERLVNLGLALVLLVPAAPLLILLYLYHLAVPSKGYFRSEKRFGAGEQMNLAGEVARKTFALYAFRSRNRLLQKLPGLINVIKGDLSLVGVSALDEQELRELPEEWREMRAKAPVGLFHLWELETPQDLEWEEKMIAENYYAVSRSLWGDLQILGKGLLATAFNV